MCTFAGLIEIGNICRNDCYYCGIRRSNPACDRYRLTRGADTGLLPGKATRSASAPLSCRAARTAHSQLDVVCHLVRQIKAELSGLCRNAVARESSLVKPIRRCSMPARTAICSATRPPTRHIMKSCIRRQMSFDNRMRCLRDLKDIGYQTGCGFMVGSPYQTARTLAEDLKVHRRLSGRRCAASARSFRRRTHRSAIFRQERVSRPVLSALTAAADPTAFAAARHHGAWHHPARTAASAALQAGANVVMPNLSPLSGAQKIRTVRRQTLYRRGGCAVHRLPVAPCGVGRLLGLLPHAEILSDK